MFVAAVVIIGPAFGGSTMGAAPHSEVTRPLPSDQPPGPGRRGGWQAAKFLAIFLVVAVTLAVLAVALSAASLLPRLRDPFTEQTIDRSTPAVLKSITALSRFEAASGSFQVIVDLARRSSFIPSFIEGTDTLFVASGSDIAFVNFGGLHGKAIAVNKNRTGVTVTLPPAQLEPAVLNVKQSYVFSEQQGLLNRIGNFFSSNPNSQHQVYVAAQQKIQAAARHSPLIAEAEKNTVSMLTGLLRSLGFRQVTVRFQP
jgi:Protein of unknown function (DUF4230)